MRFNLTSVDDILRKLNAKKVIWSIVVGSLLFIFLITIPNGAFLEPDGNFLRTFTVEECVPKNHIMLLKTHKCASSTVQNMFLRYGYKNNLTFALPIAGNYLGNPSHFKANMIPSSIFPLNGLVDIFCVHSRLDEVEMKKVLHPDTVWVTLVRNPIKLFESLFSFFHLKSMYQISLDEFGDKNLSELEKVRRRLTGKLGRNQMLFDLGSEENISVAELNRKLEELDHLFDVVIIAEKMEESLILLRHKLCWSLEDVMVFQKNARRDRTKVKLAENTARMVRDLNSADMFLYNFFLSKHRENVYKFGEERMRREVSDLRELTDEYYDYCIQTEVNGKDSRLEFKEYSGLVSSFILNNDTEEVCRVLTMPELPLIDMIRKRQMEILRRTRLEKKSAIH